MWQKNRCLCGNTDAPGVFRTTRVDAANYLQKQRCQSVQLNQREEDWGKKYPECNQQRLMGTGSRKTYGVTKINQVMSRTTGKEGDFTGESHRETSGSYFNPKIKKGPLRCHALWHFYNKISPYHILITVNSQYCKMSRTNYFFFKKSA